MQKALAEANAAGAAVQAAVASKPKPKPKPKWVEEYSIEAWKDDKNPEMTRANNKVTEEWNKYLKLEQQGMTPQDAIKQQFERTVRDTRITVRYRYLVFVKLLLMYHEMHGMDDRLFNVVLKDHLDLFLQRKRQAEIQK